VYLRVYWEVYLRVFPELPVNRIVKQAGSGSRRAS